MIRKTGIKIEIVPLSYGSYTSRPVSRKWRKAFAAHMDSYYYTVLHEKAYFQDFWQLPESVRENRRAMRELDKGYSTIVLIDPWEYGHWLGYDAHIVAERRI